MVKDVRKKSRETEKCEGEKSEKENDAPGNESGK